MDKNNNNQKQIKINANDKVLAGKYANVAKITHTQEEFIMDFMSVFPPVGTLNSRMIMSPGHVKRMLSALQENVSRYEAKFGVIKEVQGGDTVNGFPVR
jgi:hypothetical protein